MDKVLVIVVPNEASAYKAMKSLRALDDAGSIELYSAAVIAKSPAGAVTVKEKHHLAEPWGTILGLSTGALIGLLAGPIGAAVGAVVGGGTGLGADFAYSGFASDFVRDVASRLVPGGFAVCARAWEDWTVPVDQEMAPLGAAVYRQGTDDVVAAQIRADWQDLKEQEAHLDAEISKAADDVKKQLEAERSKLRAKMAEQRDRLRKRAQTLEDGWNAEMATIKAKAASAKADARARHQAHAEKLSRFAATQKAALRDLFA